MSDQGNRAAVEEHGGNGAQWPAWGVDHDGYGVLARYVSGEAVRGLSAAAGVDELRGGEDAADDRRVAEHQFERLAGYAIGYGPEPYVPPANERWQLRYPRWLRDDRVGTCVELSLAYASLCIEGRVAPLIAVDDQHAFVLLRLGELVAARTLAPLPGTAPYDGEAAHVHRVVDPDALLGAVAAGRLLPVECVAATVEHRTGFEEAVAAAGGLFAENLRLIDVVPGHLSGAPFFRPPVRPPAIAAYVPRGRRPRRLFEGQRDALAELMQAFADGGGTFVVVADQGQGKSTVAAELIQHAPDGAAWFLDASERSRLVESLADAELSRRNGTATALTKVSREEHADTALNRLQGTSDPWLVVLDNADGRPAGLGRFVPRPGPGQLVLITSTNPDWLGEPGVRSVELEPIADEELRDELGSRKVVELIGGRTLMVDAFRRFLAAGGGATQLEQNDPGEPPLAADGEPDLAARARRGPLALHRAVLAAAPEHERDALRRTAELAALLPPDRIDLALLRRIAGRAGDAPAGAPGAADDAEQALGAAPVARLERSGLLSTEAGGRRVRMHRLVGAAVRADAAEADLADAALVLARDPEARRQLDRWADAATIARFAELLEAADSAVSSPDRELGVALHDAAAVMETKGHTRQSSELYERAQRHLDRDDPRDLELLAGCWQGMARLINQQGRTDDPPELRRGLALAERARGAIAGLHGELATGRYLAMQGLLQRKLARCSNDDGSEKPPAQRRTELEGALATLERADELRRAAAKQARAGNGGAPQVDEAELLRSTYNLAGIRVSLAKVDRTRAAQLLTEADGIYERVGAARFALYGEPRRHPHIAACTHGHGIVAYHRAVLLDGSPSARAELLQAATRATLEGLGQRLEISGGRDDSDVRKSLILLGKISYARTALARDAPRWDCELADARKEALDAGFIHD